MATTITAKDIDTVANIDTVTNPATTTGGRWKPQQAALLDDLAQMCARTKPCIHDYTAHDYTAFDCCPICD